MLGIECGKMMVQCMAMSCSGYKTQILSGNETTSEVEGMIEDTEAH